MPKRHITKIIDVSRARRWALLAASELSIPENKALHLQRRTLFTVMRAKFFFRKKNITGQSNLEQGDKWEHL